MWKYTKPLLVLLSVALNVAFAVVWAAHALPARLDKFKPCAGHEGVWCPLHRQLGTTEAQWQEIEPRLLAFQKSVRAVCQEINLLRGQMFDLLSAPKPDREAIRAKQEEILAGQRRIQALVIDHLLREKQTLTPEQQAQLFSMMRRRTACAGHGPMMGFGNGGGPPCQPLSGAERPERGAR